MRFVMRMISVLFGMLLLLAAAGCSLPPEKPVTKEELYRTGVYSNFTIKEAPESVLAAINRDGEVVLDAQYKGKPLYIKIISTVKGLKVSYVEK